MKNCLKTQNNFFKEYTTRRHSILIELLRHESYLSQSSCSLCQQSSGSYRCQDCFKSTLVCAPCCISTHAQLPFHRIRMWNGCFFERTDLLTRALSLDLRHYPDDCPASSISTDTQMMDDLNISDQDDNFADEDQPTESEQTMHTGSRSELIIVSSNGIFKRSVRWCQCATNSNHYVQLLLHAKLFPASFKNPKTAFTFEVLDHFWIDALECKTAAMNFMNKLQRISDEAFPSRVPVRGTISRNRVLMLQRCAGPLSRITQGLQRVARSAQSY